MGGYYRQYLYGAWYEDYAGRCGGDCERQPLISLEPIFLQFAIQGRQANIQ